MARFRFSVQWMESFKILYKKDKSISFRDSNRIRVLFWGCLLSHREQKRKRKNRYSIISLFGELNQKWVAQPSRSFSFLHFYWCVTSPMGWVSERENSVATLELRKIRGGPKWWCIAKSSICCCSTYFILSARIFADIKQLEANPEAKRLYDDLLSNYNRLIRPVVNNTETLTVFLGLKLSQLIEVNLKNQVMTTNLWVPQVCIDPVQLFISDKLSHFEPESWVTFMLNF